MHALPIYVESVYGTHTSGSLRGVAWISGSLKDILRDSVRPHLGFRV